MIFALWALLALLPAQVLAAPVSVVDGNGRTLSLPEAPQRIVCLLINCAEELAFLGVEPVALGAGTRETMVSSGLYGAAIDAIGTVPDADGIDLEALAGFAPDLIIGFLEDAPELEAIAPTYSLNLDVERLDDVDLFLRDVRALAKLVGREAEAEARIAEVLDRHAAYVALAPAERVSFATIYAVDEGRSFWISPQCVLFVRELVTCRHPGGDDWIQSGPELLLNIDPQVVVVDDYQQGESEFIGRVTTEDPIWSALQAVANNQLHLIDGNLNRMRTIATVGPGLDALMPLLYPQTFPAPLTDAEIAAALAK